MDTGWTHKAVYCKSQTNMLFFFLLFMFVAFSLGLGKTLLVGLYFSWFYRLVFEARRGQRE